MKIFINSEWAVAFTGHRIVPFGKQREVEVKLSKAIREHYQRGCRDFLCGMAIGFAFRKNEEKKNYIKCFFY